MDKAAVASGDALLDKRDQTNAILGPDELRSKSHPPGATSANSYYVLSNGIEKPVLDEREYAAFQLPNGLRALVVSDPTCDKAGAGLSVGVGHFEDEDSLPGLAHFLEHMVFMGTEKYPDENEYSSFLSRCGGMSNACTEAEVTSFFFDVNYPHLYDMLDRFSQFFISPLMSESSQEREVRAVDSEHSKNLLQDAWRFQQLERTSASSNHPYSKFGTGDLQTLEVIPNSQRVNVRAKLIDFHSRFYKANRMALVILGREPVGTLKQWVETLFSPVPSDGAPKLMCEMTPRPSYLPGELFPLAVRNRVTFVEPIKEKYTVEVAWEIPSTYRDFRIQPIRYAEHVLGYEGKGSLFSNLKERELAVGLTAGVSFECIDFSILKVTVDCTQKGARENFRQVLATIFEYCELMRGQGVSETIFKEMQLLEQLRFRFQSTPETFRFMRSASAALLRYPSSKVMTAEAVVEEFDASAIQQCLNCLVPARAKALVAFQGVTKAFPSLIWEKEKWYGTEFALNEATLEKLCAEGKRADNEGPRLSLPQSNPFIPVNFTLKVPREPSLNVRKQMQLVPPSRASGLPANHEVYYKTDRVYGQPKVVFKTLISAPLCYATPRASVLAELVAGVASDALNELAYDAEVAGLSWSFNNSVRGMVLTIAGYSDKVRVLLDAVMKAISSLDTYSSERILLRQMEKMSRTLNNFYKESPYQVVMYESSVALNVPRWSIRLKREAFSSKKVTVEELKEFVRHAFLNSSAKVSSLIIGNIIRLEAIEMSEIVWSRVGFEPGFIPTAPRVIAVPDNAKTYFLRFQNPDSVNSSIEFLCQLGMESRSNQIDSLAFVLANLTEEPCFDELRTKQQLGYIVNLGLRRDGAGVWSLRILIQSSNYNVEALVDRTIDFLVKMEEILESYSDEEFRGHVESSVQLKLEADLSLSDESRRWWDEIEYGTFRFDRDQVMAREIKAITRGQILDLFRRSISPRARGRRYFISAMDAKEGTPAAPSRNMASWGMAKTSEERQMQLIYNDLLGEVVELTPENIPAWKEECSLWACLDRAASSHL